MEIMQGVTLIAVIALTIVYSVVIYMILHHMFHYVFFGKNTMDCLEKMIAHILGIAAAGVALAMITLLYWKITDIIVAVIGIVIALSRKNKDEKVGMIVITVIAVIVITILGMVCGTAASNA